MSPISFTEFYNTIAGKNRSSSNQFQAVDPSDETLLWKVPVATAEDLNDAVISAQKAFKSWSKTPWEQRQSILTQLHDELLSHQAKLVTIIMKEAGKPAHTAALEVNNAATSLKYHAQETEPLEETIQDDDAIVLTQRFLPRGIVGAISPWNFPLILSMGKISAALITGNCIIVKPSPFTPYAVLKFVEIAQNFLPPGVLQTLNGDDKLGPLMTEHPGIDMISFTGSTATGRRVMMSASKTLKHVTLELGGNSASIICPDVDIMTVAGQVAVGTFFNSGQLCVASKRLYVHQDIYEQFLVAIAQIVKSWKVGPASVQGTVLGPVQNQMQYKVVKSILEDSLANDHKFILGGASSLSSQKGFTIQPAIVENPPHTSRIVTEEQFGPIVPIMPWSTEEEVISKVNDTETGLGGAVWSADLDRAKRIAREIESGTIWINSFEKPLSQAYFQGFKQSGVGGEGGRYGLLTYMNVQTTHIYKESVAPKPAAKASL
ncbi:aldehyde dehydrogenase [Phlyctema vagabunda]|uniref:aldehyde dehydrogenase (NAD(+)) n=1 Tax=Phlyctema vagabunda TaxID=108571 RepID=A0ABR4PU17_9HELO